MVNSFIGTANNFIGTANTRACRPRPTKIALLVLDVGNPFFTDVALLLSIGPPATI